MFNKLRNRLIVSHLIPYLLLIPIMGFIFIYLVETQVIFAGVASELTGQGILVVELAQNAPEIWTDPTAAQAFNQKLAAKVDARLMLLTPQGTLLSSSDPADTTRIGQILPIEKKASLSVGQIYANVDHSQQLQTEVVDVLLPVIDANGSMIGIIRLSQRLSDVYQRFSQLRVTIVGILAGGLLLTIVFSIALSINVERPLRRLTESVQKIIAGKRDSLLVEQGPQEVRILQHSFNQLSSLLNEQEQLRRRLIANLVHELGRSLGALRAAIQALLRNGIKNPELAQDLVAGMDEETKQLRRLLDDLANLQDVLAGSLRLEMQPLQLSEWLPVVLRPWEVMAHEKGLTWSENIPKNLPTINADSTRLDQALGHARQPLSPRRPIPAMSARLAFPEPIGHSDDIARATGQLLAELCGKLAAADLGARRLELTLYRTDATVARDAVGTSRPVRDPGHLERLFREKLAALDAGFGVEVMTLAASVVDPLAAVQTPMGFERSFAGEDTANFVDRVCNRLGPENVVRLREHGSHIPERSCREVSALTVPKASDNKAPHHSQRSRQPRPLTLLPWPEPIEAMAAVPDGPPVMFRRHRVQHRVIAAEGPERIGPEWWLEDQGCNPERQSRIRDYYRVEDSEGQRFWIYREGVYRPESPPRWYLHGLFP